MKYFNGKKISSARFDGKRSGEVQFFTPGNLPDIGGQSPTPNLTTPPPRVGRDVFTIIPRGGCDGCVNTNEQRWWGWVEDSDPSQTGEILYLHLSQQPRPNEINSTEIYYTSFPVSGGNNLIGTAMDQVRIVDNGTETVYTASGLLNGINGEGSSENTALDLSTMRVGVRGIRAPDVNQNLVELIDFSFAWNSGAYLTMGGGISLLFRYIQENGGSWQGTTGLGFDGYGELGAEFTPVITRQDLENAASDGKNSQAFKKVLFRPNITNDITCDITPCVTEPPRIEDPIIWWEPPPPITTTTTTTPAPTASGTCCSVPITRGGGNWSTFEIDFPTEAEAIAWCEEQTSGINTYVGDCFSVAGQDGGYLWARWRIADNDTYSCSTQQFQNCQSEDFVASGDSLSSSTLYSWTPSGELLCSDPNPCFSGYCLNHSDYLSNTVFCCQSTEPVQYFAYDDLLDTTYASGECPDGYTYIGDSSTGGDNVCCDSFLNGIPLSSGDMSTGACFYYSPCSPAMEGPNYLP